MKSIKINQIYRLSIVFLLIGILTGCAQNKIEPIQENYEYSQKSMYYLKPEIVDGFVRKTALSTSTDDGNFYVFSEDESVANEFVNSERTLVSYLRRQGMDISGIKYYGMDYGYSFSKSSAYISLSDIRSWQQVLVTLQTVWGDYTDYGYLYALSNAIAEELEWETDAVPAYDADTMDSFFREAPTVINLLYPTFTTKLASEETVNNSKALAAFLLEDIKWKRALSKPISDQLDDYYESAKSFAERLSVPFTRQAFGYAYYGENIKLRIMTSYAEIIIEDDFHDTREYMYGDCWNDWASIYETTSIINGEITRAVDSFGLQDKVGIITLKLIDNDNEWKGMYLSGNSSGSYLAASTAYVKSLFSYLHEYYHHIELVLKESTPHTWQSQAFCEIGSSYSFYRQKGMEEILAGELKDETDYFYAYTGREYRVSREDYFEANDIFCYMYDYDDFDYHTGGPSINSINRYLIDIYGEKAVYNMMLYPDTVEEVTGKTWDQLSSEWEQYLCDKYGDVKLP